MTIDNIQDWWNTLEEDDMIRVYRSNCKHNYVVQQTESNLFCTNCEDTITVDTDTYVFNHMHELKDILNGATTL